MGINNRQRRAAKQRRRRQAGGGRGGGRGGSPWPGGSPPSGTSPGARGGPWPGSGAWSGHPRSGDPWAVDLWPDDPWDDDDPWDEDAWGEGGRWVGGGREDECERLAKGRTAREDAASTLGSLRAVVLSSPGVATRYAESVLDGDAAHSAEEMAEVLREDLARLFTVVVQHGWLPSDLAEVTRRRVAEDAVPAVAGLLRAEQDRHSTERVADAWRDDLNALGESGDLSLDTVGGMAAGLRLDALLAVLPVIATLVPPPGSAPPASSVPPGSTSGLGGSTPGMDTKVLARVRALLAKAESTDFPDEAEVLSAKAQELISRYALDRLWVTDPQGAGAHDPELVRTRLWIDPPYVMPKALLIGAVADANRCRSVVTEDPGFCTLVGTASDVEAVEVLSTSLLVQATAAMTRHGSQMDALGRSRTRSFRHSFLLSYATRIGERLRAATESAVADTGHTTDLVPILRRHAERVDAAVDETFPQLRSRQSSVSNGLGWAAGRVAADLARLDVRGEVTGEAG